MYAKIQGKDLQSFRGRKVILFGCGSYGIRVQEEFENVGANIIAYCDNNKDLQGTTLNGYRILAPEQLYDYPDTDIIIASTFHKEIGQQLDEMKLYRHDHILLGVFREKITREQFANPFLADEEANRRLQEGLTGKKPFFTGRLGSVELECIAHYLYFLNRKLDKSKNYPNNVKMMMNIFAGFFPKEELLLDEFSVLSLQGLCKMDMIWTMWSSKYEDMIYSEFCQSISVADYDNTVFPVGNSSPWTAALKGKKVLVIHPFAASIQENYKRKDKLFENKDFLPDFELITYKPVQSIAGNETGYATWFEALAAMEEDIRKIDFDIALIGAGAYGLPLGAYVKELGKKAVHVGGILQLYFGIRGKAWDKFNYHNEFWTRPLEEERPKGLEKVEAGRYW